MVVADWLSTHARRRPAWPALITPDGGVLSYGVLAARVAHLAKRLRTSGVQPGDRLLALLPAGSALVELLHACARVGAVLAPLDPRATAAEVAYAAACVRPRVVVGTPAASALLAEVARACGAATELVAPDAAPFAGVAVCETDAAPAAPATIDLARPYTIVFTSGTTGRPRAIVASAGNHLASARAAASRLGAAADDRWLACLPLHHVGGLAVLLRAAIAGGTVVLQRGFDPAAVAGALHEHRITQLSLVPTALRRLLDVPRATPAALRALLLGGARADVALVAAARARGWPVAPTYGLTETCSQIATVRPADAVRSDGFVGTPLAGVEIRVRTRDGRSAPPGEAGVLAVRGAMVALGALTRDGALEPLAADGWLVTADRGVLAADGGLTVLGRADDVIVSGGENVAPEEVEAALLEHPAVAEAGVAGIADAEWGQVVCAWIVPRAGRAPSLGELRDFCGTRLARHKLPRRLTVVTSLARTASGKLKRHLLAGATAPERSAAR